MFKKENMPVTGLQIEQLPVKILENRTAMGEAAARNVAERIKSLLEHKTVVNMIFAAAPSQNEFLEKLAAAPGIQWERINAFHMDEYIGLEPGAPQLFSAFLKDRIFSKVNFKTVNIINGNAPDIKAECERYAGLLRQYPADIVCMGIGENTHIAFNDPHVADFNDPFLVKTVTLDAACRQQQVNDGCFASLDLVPAEAITLTIPALMAAEAVFCMVPGKNKAVAIHRTITGQATALIPSTALRSHPDAVLFVDKDAAAVITSQL